MADKKVLNEEELVEAVGGYLFKDNSRDKWQVIDDLTGDVEYESSFKEYAQNWAERYGYSTDTIDWYKVDQLRKDWAAKKNQSK